MNQLYKLLIEAGPLVIFFIANGQWGIYAATAVFMTAMIISMVASRILLKEISLMLWLSVALVTIFGGATLYFEDEAFIKIKPTILYSLFAAVLLLGTLLKKPFIRNVMEAGFPPLEDVAWTKMNFRWGVFFLFCALLNEYIWRTYDTQTWIAAKLWLFMPLSFVFAMAQVPLIMKYQIEEDAPEKE
ncbi:septation protein A [Luteithermobacter gelatinilyticus]|uniref:septation protein A n=1 Tax=Luteithermobacter gelatinilyticus TaxID=2582913 RepID=UPI001106A6FD|nr:septation protein A [Luteithermobacter gelatinilyticus]|tara:strand:- start:3756 stop:4316 length:561 start_codon:yes stop_codon:yes gene_type:complete